MSAGAKETRVFISYARSDGEDFARDLRMKLEAEKISVWQDRVSMEGGHEWLLQIEEALKHVEFMVLILTPAALQSPNVRHEWLLARRSGVCIYPVKVQTNPEFVALPRWMSKLHFYDLVLDQAKLLKDLNNPCKKVRVPFVVEDLPKKYVARPDKLNELISKLLDDKRENPLPTKLALQGAGGYGKTTLAKALCHEICIQDAFDNGILWVKLGQNPGDLVKKVNNLIDSLDKESTHSDELNTATAYFVELLEERDILLVIDDVWNPEHLKPFLQGGKHCARLICSRNDMFLSSDIDDYIQVDAMQPKEALQLLCKGLVGVEDIEEDIFRELAVRLGKWPLGLELINRKLLFLTTRTHKPLPDALNYINELLDKDGLMRVDQAMEKTLKISFEQLIEKDFNRYRELAVFPKDVDIPLATIQRLWHITGGLDGFHTESLCIYLFSLSLLLDLNFKNHTIRLHNVISTYLQEELGAELDLLHRKLLDIYQLEHWANLSQEEPYLWDYLAFHLIEARHVEELIATVTDLDYVAAKIHVRNVRAIEADLILAEAVDPTNTIVPSLRRSIASMDYLLNSCKTIDEIKLVLHSRLAHLNVLSELCKPLEQELSHPFITSWHSLPDLPDPALIRTLQGHLDPITACAVSPKGDYIVSASQDENLEAGILKIWDAQTGIEKLILYGHKGIVLSCAVNPDGDRIVSASRDNTLKVWDVETGEALLNLDEHSGPVNCCVVSREGDYIVSASDDGTLKVWDALTGNVRMSLDEHLVEVTGCAISPSGDYIVSSLFNGNLNIWDARTGELLRTLTGHIDVVTGCAVSPLGDYIVSSSQDGTLKIWDTKTGEVLHTLTGHTDVVTGCAVSPLGDCFVSSSYDKTIKVWDLQTGTERSTFKGHGGPVTGCAVSPQGDWIVSASVDKTLKMWNMNIQEIAEHPELTGHTEAVKGCIVSANEQYAFSASEDKTLKIWNAQTGKELRTLYGHEGQVNSCAVSPQGDWIVSASDDESLKIWDVETGEQLRTLKGHKGKVNGCAVSPEGGWLVSASNDGSLKIWDVQTGEIHLNLEDNASAVNGCAVNSKGDCIVSALADGSLNTWDVNTGGKLLTLADHSLGVSGCAVNPEGDWIVSASRDTTLKIWNLHTGEVISTLDGHTKAVNGCVVSPKGDYILSVSDDKTLKIWETHTGKCLATLPVDGNLWGCAFYPDGEHIVAGGERGLYFLRLIR